MKGTVATFALLASACGSLVPPQVATTRGPSEPTEEEREHRSRADDERLARRRQDDIEQAKREREEDERTYREERAAEQAKAAAEHATDCASDRAVRVEYLTREIEHHNLAYRAYEWFADHCTYRDGRRVVLVARPQKDGSTEVSLEERGVDSYTCPSEPEFVRRWRKEQTFDGDAKFDQRSRACKDADAAAGVRLPESLRLAAAKKR